MRMRPLEKVIGYNSIKKEFYKIIDVLNNPEKYEKLGVHMAKCFIEECKRKSYIIRKDRPNGNFVDYIRETFEDAEKKHRLLFCLMIWISMLTRIIGIETQKNMLQFKRVLIL